MRWGKQHRHCPNCGQALYDEGISMRHVTSMMCSDKCRQEWETKHAAMVLGRDAPPLEPALTEVAPEVAAMLLPAPGERPQCCYVHWKKGVGGCEAVKYRGNV